MQSRKRLSILASLTLLIFASSGCDLTIGPKVKDRTVIMHPGEPFEITRSVTATGRVLDDTGGVVTQDIGGWIAMPPDHWDVVKRAIEKQASSK